MPPTTIRHLTSCLLTCRASSSISPSPSRIGSPFFTAFVRPAKIHRHGELAAENFSRRDHEWLAVLQPYAVTGDRADADLGTGQILQDGDLAAEFTFEVANFADQAAVKRVIAVAEVQPRDVHAGPDQAFQHLI